MITNIETITNITQAIVTTIALIVAGFWTYLIFVRTRQRYPRVEITHDVFDIAILEEKRLLRVTIIVRNHGKVLLELVYGRVWIQQVVPFPDAFLSAVQRDQDPVVTGSDSPGEEYGWPIIAERNLVWTQEHREVEPGETERIDCDLIVPKSSQTVVIYTYLKNWKKKRYGLLGQRSREIGWNRNDVYEIGKGFINGSTTKKTKATSDCPSETT